MKTLQERLEELEEVQQLAAEQAAEALGFPYVHSTTLVTANLAIVSLANELQQVLMHLHRLELEHRK